MSAGIVKDEALTGRVMPAAEVRGCEVCGQVKPDVRVCIDRFAADINGELVEMRLCGACEQARADDI